MDLPTYTRIWRIEKRLYKLYDFRLPYPVSLVTIGVFVGTTVVWCLLMSLVGVPFAPPVGHVLWLVPPGVITFLATRPVIEGKSLTGLLRSQLVYGAEARVYTRLAPQREPERIVVSALVWRRDPAAGPLPTPGGRTARRRERQRDARPDTAAEPVTESTAAEEAVAPADVAAPEPAAPRRPRETVRTAGKQRGTGPSLSRRVLNYFGFGLEPDRSADTETVSPPTPRRPEPRTPATRRTELAPTRSRDDAPSPSFLSGRDVGDTAAQTHEDEDWYAALGMASGLTPWPPDEKTSGADRPAEPEEPDDGESQRRAAEERAAARRRAEEIMSAPEPEAPAESAPASAAAEEPEAARAASPADIPTQPSRAEDFMDSDAERAHQRAGRRLRGRAQGRTIARRREQDRAETAVETEQSPQSPSRAGHGHGTALPATPEEAREERELSRPRPRPHAAPWDLPPVARTTGTGVPEPSPSTASSPWDEIRDAAPPAATETAGTAERETEEVPAAPVDDTAATVGGDSPEESRETGAADTGDAEEPSARAEGAGAADGGSPAEPAPREITSLADRIRAGRTSRMGKPPLELDHGTGEHDSFTDVTRHRPTEGTAQEEPPASSASASPEAEQSATTRAAEPDVPAETPRKPHWELDHGTGAWEQIAAAREQEAAEPARPEPEPERPEPAAPAAARRKPPLELDHGTGEHDSFTDVTRHRRTEEELAAIEQAALRRRALDGERTNTPEPDDGPAAGTERTDPPRPSNRLARGVRSAGSTPDTADGTDSPDRGPAAAEPERSTEPESERGLLTRFVDNARRVGGMLTPARGTTGRERGHDGPDREVPADKPDLQLDHGTGEQQLFSDSTTPGRGSTPPATAPDDRETAAHTEDSPSGGTRGWRRLARVVTGGNSANSRPQLPPAELERLRTPLDGSRGLVVLGCTGGAGQTVTTLMLGHTLAAYRDDRVVAVDINPGPESLSRRVRTETPETLTSLLANTDALHVYSSLRGYTSQTPSGLEVVATLDDPYVQTLDDRDYATLTATLRRHYTITLLDPAATGVARALPVVDGLVLVAPASSDAARSVALTFEWLDGHGYADLRSRAIVVINGVSRRSLADVDAAEQVARGNCRAIVRVPWDDHIAATQSVIEVRALRQTTRRAYAALSAVVAANLAAHATSEAKR
ncbi:TcpE family conjugal transfer membrane protein [Thermobifida halotolerans]|uniref:TcpE family conjugal transfer membrane protein n=1 Tax=Thermobifida halotolerans TaxID=483545 RepID=UPI000B0369DB|nr:TcpE family conjugal transfer membrane protein [Thermobifida halotolerans]